jgi:signal transduction histidine kinase
MRRSDTDAAAAAAEFSSRMAFLGLTPEDAERLAALQPVFQQHARDFAERFYQHLLAHPHTAAYLRDPAQLERLKQLQADYFAALLEGVFDETYREGRTRVGHAHQRVGLEPVWYLGAYNQYVQITFPLFVQALGGDVEKMLPHLLSLMKVIFLDIGLALDTYFAEATEKYRRRNDELQKALGLYWQTQKREQQLRRLASHEIRGGLAAIITNLEDLLDEARPRLDPAVAERLEQIGRRCWSLSGLLGEMLAPTAPQDGPTWVETASIFDSLAGRISLHAADKTIELRLPEHAPRVWADPLQLREVFANLVANAVRYGDKERGLVEITCRPNGEFWEFCVADNGPGIPPSIHERLFQPFVRGPAHPGQPAGTGLGLYFVRTVIEQGGGKVWVESEPGRGCRFFFTVPRVQPTTASEPRDV